MLEIRPAEPRDLEAITEIYNDAILTTTATFDTGPKTLAEQRASLAAHGPKYPILVAEADGVVVAWASSAGGPIAAPTRIQPRSRFT